MAWKNGFGIILVLVGVFLVIAQPFSPTGAVIDLSTSQAKMSFGVGIVMIITGIILVLTDNSKRQYESTLVGRINNTAMFKPGRGYKDFKIGYGIEEKYGNPPKASDEKQWITLYHATPILNYGQFKRFRHKFIDNKRAFHVAQTPEEAERQSGLEPGQAAILKVKIAKPVYHDIELEARFDPGAPEPTYKIPKKNARFVNNLYRKGYIRLERGR